MTFLLVLILILLVLIFILFVNYKSESSKKIDSLLRQTEDIRRYLRAYEIVNPNATQKITEEVKKTTSEKTAEVFEEKNISSEIPVEKAQTSEPVEEKQSKEPEIFISPEIKEVYVPQAETQTKTSVKPKKETDWEKIIGENLLVKIAVGVLVLGVAFFIKWAIDNEWINEIGRVALGFGAGAGLLVLGFLSRKKYNAFSSVLTGGGLAALYISVALGFQLYHLFSQSAAFVVLIVITTASVALSLAYNKKELAAFAVLGGFASPFLVTTGQGNYIVLFSYILILDLGMLALAYFKKWNLINIISLAATIILYGGWLGSVWYDKNMPYQNALIFGTAFYVIFFLMFIVSNLRENKKFKAFEMILLLLTTFCYYAAGMFIIHEINPEYKGLFTVSVALFNFAFMYPLYKTKKVDMNLIYMLIAIILTFLSLTAPVQLNGQYITLFWAAETVTLLWISQKSGMKLILAAAGVVFVLMTGSLFMDWYQLYINPKLEAGTLPILANKAFITSISVILSMIVTFRLLKNDATLPVLNNITPDKFRRFNIVFIIIFMYFAGFFELNYQLNERIEAFGVRNIFIAFYDVVYLTAVLVWSGISRARSLFFVLAAISYFTLFVFVVFFGTDYRDVIYAYVNGETNQHFYVFRFATSLVAVFAAVFAVKYFSDIQGISHKMTKFLMWLSTFFVVLILSVELFNMALILKKEVFTAAALKNGDLYYYGDVRDVIFENVARIWFPVLWASCAFVLMIVGMRKEIRDLRIISLVLVFLTLGKLVAFDVWQMSQVGRVITFISVGVILLIVAFLYQKLKKFVLGDETNDDNVEI